jgi:hypothetical protein
MPTQKSTAIQEYINTSLLTLAMTLEEQGNLHHPATMYLFDRLENTS